MPASPQQFGPDPEDGDLPGGVRTAPPSAPGGLTARVVLSNPPVDRDTAALIVNWNTRDLLWSCLKSLDQKDHRRLARIIVVDNDSHDGSAEMVRDEYPSVGLVQPGCNTGYAAGNNRGLALVQERYVLLLNPDTEVRAGALDSLAAFLDVREACAAVGPQLVSPDGSVQPSCRSFPSPGALLADKLGLSIVGRIFPSLGAYRLSGWAHDTVRRVDQPMGTALMVRMTAVADVGLMDEQFPLFFNEVDWLYRMSAVGWEIWFTPEAKVLHHGGSSTRQVWVKAGWLSHTGLHAFYRKHYRKRMHPALYALMVAVIYLRAIVTVTARFLARAAALVRGPRT